MSRNSELYGSSFFLVFVWQEMSVCSNEMRLCLAKTMSYEDEFEFTFQIMTFTIR